MFLLRLNRPNSIRKFESINAIEIFYIYRRVFCSFVCTLRIIMEFAQIHVALVKSRSHRMYVWLLCYIWTHERAECDIDSIICIPKRRHSNAMSQVVNCVHWDYLISLVHRIVRYFSLSSNHRNSSKASISHTFVCVCVCAYLTGGDPTSGLLILLLRKIIRQMDSLGFRTNLSISALIQETIQKLESKIFF